MKISNPQTNSPAGVEKTASVATSPTSSAATQKGASAADGVQLSSLGQYLASAINGSPAHIEKLGVLSGAIASGQYNVDASTISGSLIQYSLQSGGVESRVRQ